MPLIRTCGSQDDDCFGYNPPDAVTSITLELSAVDDQKWSELIPRRIEQYRRVRPELTDEFSDIVSKELDHARMAFSVLCTAYSLASERGLGVACEYSL